MSGQGGNSEEKTLPASPKKLRDARKKGQIARSREMVTAIVSVAGFGTLFVRADALFDGLRDGVLLAGVTADEPFADAAGRLATMLGRQFLWTLGPFLGVLLAAAVLTNVAVNGGALAALDPVLPKLDRLDPIAGFGRLFSMRNIIEMVKSVLKVALVGAVACLIVALSVQALVEQPSCGLGCAAPLLRGLLRPLLIAACGFFLVLGGFDIGLQRWLFGRDMRMTKTEQKRERKELEGDPLIKRQHRREQRAALHAAVRTGLRNATFIVRSPELALAFRFAKPDAMVPVLVARAAADAAPVLLEAARDARIPVVSNADTARVLSRMKVGHMVDKEFFQLVIACMREAGVM